MDVKWCRCQVVNMGHRFLFLLVLWGFVGGLANGATVAATNVHEAIFDFVDDFILCIVKDATLLARSIRSAQIQELSEEYLRLLVNSFGTSLRMKFVKELMHEISVNSSSTTPPSLTKWRLGYCEGAEGEYSIPSVVEMSLVHSQYESELQYTSLFLYHIIQYSSPEDIMFLINDEFLLALFTHFGSCVKHAVLTGSSTSFIGQIN